MKFHSHFTLGRCQGRMPKPGRRPCAEAWGRGARHQPPGLSSAGVRGHWPPHARRRQGGPAGGACRFHGSTPPTLDPGPGLGPALARSFSAGCGMLPSLLHGLRGPPWIGGPKAVPLPGPARASGGGGERGGHGGRGGGVWWEPCPAIVCTLPSAAPWLPGPSQALGLPPRPRVGFRPGARASTSWN